MEEVQGISAKEAWQMLQAVDDGRVIAPAGQEQVQLLQLLFFGNRR